MGLHEMPNNSFLVSLNRNMLKIFCKTALTLLITQVISSSTFAQVSYTINGQYMNRFEYRHGQSTLAAPGQDPAFFISQRARLYGEIHVNPVTFRLSIQDVRVWGSTSNVDPDISGQLAVHEAWANLKISPKLNLKMGRQEIKYDEARIFGNLDWAMQARRHDAALLLYYDSIKDIQLDAGFAFNQDGPQSAGTIYTLNQYKTFQYLYFKKPFGNVLMSLLFLNNGNQILDTSLNYSTVFSQTIGPRFSSINEESRISWNAAFYYQGGKTVTMMPYHHSTYRVKYRMNFRRDFHSRAEWKFYQERASSVHRPTKVNRLSHSMERIIFLTGTLTISTWAII